MSGSADKPRKALPPIPDMYGDPHAPQRLEAGTSPLHVVYRIAVVLAVILLVGFLLFLLTGPLGHYSHDH